MTRWPLQYREQAEALIEGGVDILLIETSQDLLQAKIAWRPRMMPCAPLAGKRSRCRCR